MKRKTFTGGRDRSARLYDRICRWCETKGLLEARQRTVGDLTGDILEIGAGTGLNFEHYPAEATVFASDLDPVMLSRAAFRAPKARADVSLFLGDATRLPIEDSSVDTVVIGLMLCSVESQERVFAELRRVLRPGGRVRFVEHVRAHDGTVLGWIQDLVNPVWRRVSGGCNANRRTVKNLETSGFKIEDVTELRIGRFHTSPHVVGEASPN